jgi:ABC-type branched-subunit amino acid transport system substrate-binding protein
VTYFHRRWGDTGPFGAPNWVAAQVLATAIDRACRDGRATRAEVRANVARTRLRASLLGIPVSFAKGGDLRRSRFFIYKVAGSKLVLVQ